jgi:hypothetical protein
MIVKAHWVLAARIGVLVQGRRCSGPGYNCYTAAGSLPPPGAKIIELWSNPHKIWCCENMGVACATSSDSEKVGLGTAEDLWKLEDFTYENVGVCFPRSSVLNVLNDQGV